ncbi:hypothetical protein F4779DRAFT_620474 [Xylariaceae sp. FL0662B]|nr:hypothetical protein F4779DRAFT_620474 [Xylariaceae sp. FL0662B]
MVSLRAVFVAAFLFSSTVRAAAVGVVPVAPVAPVATLTPRRDPWAEHMKKLNYPPNDQVCKMVKNENKKVWQKSKASDYFSIWFQENGNKLNDWVQKMHKNATKPGVTPGDLDCTMLHSENCSPPQDRDCENYNPAAFRIIHTQVVNLYSVLQALDIAAIKQTLLNSLDIGTLIGDFTKKSQLDNRKKAISITAISMWILSGMIAITGLGAPIGITLGSTALVGSLTAFTATTATGAFLANTAGGIMSKITTPAAYGLMSSKHCILGIMSQVQTDKGAIDVDKLDAQLSSKLGEHFQRMSDRNAALTAKLFGGKPKQDIKLMDLASSHHIDPLKLGAEMIYDFRFQNGDFMDQPKTENLLQPMFDAGFKYMRVGLIGFLFNVRKFYVLHFTGVDKQQCEKKFQGASRYVDNDCYVLKIGGGKKINHDDNAPTELKRAEEKYHMNVAEFFRNVRNCNNNKDLIDRKSYSTEKMGEITKCFYPLNYLKARTPDTIKGDVDHNIAKQIGVKVS